jgi:tRNA threonylcarbamoyladenosine biosynthesis protein TsaB
MSQSTENKIKILAIETTTEAFSVALRIGENSIEHFAIAPMQHGELILTNIEKLLSEAALTLQQLDAIAVSYGPGSFTGVRLGVSAAQGLAFGAGLPVIPVSSLRTLAQGAYAELNATHVLTAIDARMHGVYCAAYSVDANGLMQAIIADNLAKPDAIPLPELFADKTWQGVGNAWQIYAEQICGVVYSGKKCCKINGLQKKAKISSFSPDFRITSEIYPHAKYVAQIAATLYTQKQDLASPQDLLPIYLRDTVTS